MNYSRTGVGHQVRHVLFGKFIVHVRSRYKKPLHERLQHRARRPKFYRGRIYHVTVFKNLPELGSVHTRGIF